MSARRGCVVALALMSSAGCRQLLGFEDPVLGNPDDVDAPIASYEITGTYRQRFGGNDANGTPLVVRRIRPVGELPMSVVNEDGTPGAVDYREDGTFSFRSTGGTYRLIIGNVEYQHITDHLELGEYYPGRSDVMPVTLPTTLQVRLGAQPSGYPYLVTTGIWGQYVAPVAMGVGDFDVDWAAVNSQPPFGLLEANKNDLLYVGYIDEIAGAQPYLALTRIHAGSITQNDGQTSVFSASAMPVSRNLCVRQQARRAAAIARVRLALPMFTTLTGEYRISAAPVAEFQFLPNLLLAYDVTSGSDANLDVRYGNPFPGTQVLSGVSVSGSRDVALAGVSGLLRLGIVGIQSYQIAADASCAVSMPILGVGIAAVPSLAGAPLTDDDALLVIPGSEPFTLTWRLAYDGPVDYSIALLYEVITTTSPPRLQEVRRFITVGQSVSIARDALLSGRRYVVGIQTILGAPGALTGSFEVTQYPTGFMTTLSSPFRIGG